jgi:hypothetical protein
MRTVVRETVLRRRRSRLPWIYLVYHARSASAAGRRGGLKTVFVESENPPRPGGGLFTSVDALTNQVTRGAAGVEEARWRRGRLVPEREVKPSRRRAPARDSDRAPGQ